jgi:hypothetical protein
MRLSLAAILIAIFALTPVSDASARARQDDATVKLNSTLVMVPVVASDRNGVYIHDLGKKDFTLYEDGVEQEVIFFATVSEPFHVVLMLDTSASTREKLDSSKRAALAFMTQLQPEDRVKVISFADAVRDHGDFTNETAELRRAVEELRSGQGTKVYDAFQKALAALSPIKGRKAIVFFTDGVDMYSESATYEQNIRAVEESGIIIYPIRYDTRADTEALVRQGRRPAPDVLGVPGARVPIPTPSGDPRIPRVPGTGMPEIVLPYPNDRNRYPDRHPDGRVPNERLPGGRHPDERLPRRVPDAGGTHPDDPRSPHPDPRTGPKDPAGVELDAMYQKADDYLKELAEKSGGRLLRADSLASLPAAFGEIAAELRTQYALGYYPTNGARDGGYRKIQVRTSRKNAVVRARPGYRAASAQ